MAKSGGSLNGVPGNMSEFINYSALDTLVHIERGIECDPYSGTIGVR